MPRYQATAFDPPAPVAEALVVGPTGQGRLGVPLVVDSGADVSIVPLAVATEVGATFEPRGALLQLFDGSQVACNVAGLEVRFLGYRFRGRFVLTDAEHGVIGRNILNLLMVTLDGPHQEWSA